MRKLNKLSSSWILTFVRMTTFGICFMVLGSSPAMAGHNDYFQSLAVHPNTIFNRSYRHQREIDLDKASSQVNTTVLYDASENAAQFTIAQDRTSLKPQIRPLFQHITSGNLLYIWDARWGAEYADDVHRDALHTYKAYQLARTGGGDNRRLELRTIFTRNDPSTVARVDLRRYHVGATGPDQGVPGQLNEFLIIPETWTRYWALIDFDNGTFSWWMADEGRSPVVIFDRLPMNFDVSGSINSGNGYNEFWFEYNSSQSRVGPPLTGHFRNMIVMKDISDLNAIINQGATVEATGLQTQFINRPPVVVAPIDLTIAVSEEKKIFGKVTDDDLPSANSLTTSWTGPAQVQFNNTGALDPKITINQLGFYDLTLTGSDGQYAKSDVVRVKVVNPPTVDAGTNLSIKLGDLAFLDATVSADVQSVQWSRKKGPKNGFTIVDPLSVDTNITFTEMGTYVFELEVDNGELTRRDSVEVLVHDGSGVPPPPDNNPVASAGDDISITLPENVTTTSVQLDGSASSDVEGPIVAYRWSGSPNPDDIVNPIVDLGVGFYVFTLEVEDNAGKKDTDRINVSIYDSNGGGQFAPFVNAGQDIEKEWPETVELNAIVTDDGLPNPPAAVTLLWSKESGPGLVQFADETSEVTTATFESPGTYVLRLTADDSALSSHDDIQVILNAPAGSSSNSSVGPFENALSVENGFTTSIPCASPVDIYDRSGRLVSRLKCNGGFAEWNASNTTSGIYIVFREGLENRKIAVIR